MSTTLIVTHKVKDFASWKTAFDADETNRIHAGLRVKGLYQSIEDANEVTLISEADDIEKVKAMFSSPDFQKVMQDAGVVSEPQIKLLKSAL